ncbi:DUF4150 domain-containing protein [Salmonella enterica]|nr:DUF4150 domain-containing protein [Salmonella enterica]EJH7441133.1 DUF4150 domain-containing protein [Salmonella enterica]EJH7880502.1 DUF4150 domain-containing protein [Salmonella enterica]EJI6713251.1 DUF4150 domain-containing protein [Salmonella enterica]
METQVYINDREASSKASDGVSKAAFPDPCWTPPPPPAGPIVVPYPNTAYASTMKAGTTTVFICNSMVAKEDISYFSTSTGDEGATQTQPKGVITGVIKGKAYFKSWSPNVKFEGKCVARHEDLMTHNHGSEPGNTGLFPYVSRGFFGGHACEDEQKKIEKACAQEKEDNDSPKKEIRSKSKLWAAIDKIKNRNKNRQARKGNNNKSDEEWNWTDDHCFGLDLPLDLLNAEEYLKDLSEMLESMKAEFDLMERLEDVLKDLAIHAAEKAAAKVAIKAAAKQALGSVVPAAGNAVMAIWTVVDIAVSVGEVADIKAAAEEALKQLEILKQEYKRVLDLSSRIEKLKELSGKELKDETLALIADGQDILALLNACTRARKCNLVPHQNKTAMVDGKRVKDAHPSNADGCCKGQQGHHLVYDSMMYDKSGSGKKKVCAKYSGGGAPTVCVEGYNQHSGSHGRIHTAMDNEVRKLVETGQVTDTMSMAQAVDAAVKSHRKAFPFSGCSEKCIRAQLNSYYIANCSSARPRTTDKNGNPHKRGDVGNNH